MDTHAHVFRHDLALAGDRRYAPGYDAPCDAFLRHLDAHGLAGGVLVQPSFLGTDNGFLVECLRAHPDRLRGVAVVEPDAPEATLTALAAAGVVGIRLNLVGRALPDLGAPRWLSFLERVASLGWHVEVHREARDLPALVGPLLDAGVPRVVVDHFGRYDPRLGTDDPGFQWLLEAASSHLVWVKLSGAYRNGTGAAGAATARAAARLLLAAFGPERLVWGSDWPHTQFEEAVDYAQARAALDAWVPDPAQRAVLLDATPRELFRF